jgi:hypothetical protein
VKFIFTTYFGAFGFEDYKFEYVYLIKNIHFYVTKSMNLDITSRCNQQVF